MYTYNVHGLSGFSHLPLCHVTFPPARRKYYRLGQSNPKKILGCTIYKAHPISENLLKYYEEIGHFCLPCDAYDGASRHGFFCDFLEGFEWKIRKIPNSKIYIHLPSSEAQKP